MEKRQSVDQRRKAVEHFLAEHQGQLVRQGAIVTTWRRRAGRRVGPYYRLAVRTSDGRQISIYLGPRGPLVDRVSRKLVELQEPRRARRQVKRAGRQLREQLSTVRRALDAELLQVGLYRKGSEIRGWTAGLRRLRSQA